MWGREIAAALSLPSFRNLNSSVCTLDPQSLGVHCQESQWLLSQYDMILWIMKWEGEEKMKNQLREALAFLQFIRRSFWNESSAVSSRVLWVLRDAMRHWETILLVEIGPFALTRRIYPPKVQGAKRRKQWISWEVINQRERKERGNDVLQSDEREMRKQTTHTQHKWLIILYFHHWNH